MITENPEILDNLKNYPSDIGLEYNLLGWIMLDEKVMGQIGFLEPEDFYSAPHREIFEAMIKLYGKAEKITPFTVGPLLSKARLLSFEDEGGITRYLTMAYSQCHLNPWPIDIAKYLLKLSRKRMLSMACEHVFLSSSNFEDNTSAEDYIVGLSSVIDKLTYTSPLNDIQDDMQIGDEILKDLRDNTQPFSTGMKRLDECMGGGLFPSRCYGFAAKKKVGKTVLAGTISLNLSLQGIRHLFICGEMSPKEIHQRNLARLTESYPSAFRNGYGKSDVFQDKVFKAVSQSNRCMLFKNAPGLTFDELRRVYKTAVERHQVKGCILDYWQLVGGKAKGQSTSEHLDEVAQWIADFSRKHGIWSIMMAQINQEGNTRGGEGIRLAFDQVYQMKAPEDDPSHSGRWLDMMDTRYTAWENFGTETAPGMTMQELGPYFSENSR